VADDLFDTQERTEEPTQRRLDEARAQGRFARSPDLTNALVLLFVAGFLAFFGAGLAASLRGEVTGGIARLARPPGSIGQTVALVRETLGHAMKLVGPLIGIAALAAFLLHFVQAGGFYVVRDAMKLRFERFDLVQNLRKMFALKSWIKLLAGVVKFAVILGVVVLCLRGRMATIGRLNEMELGVAAAALAEILVALLLQVTAALVVLGGADYTFQRWQHRREMRMSKQQIRDESRQEDGDPNARRSIRQRMRALIERPLRQAIPEATVIVTNPTHVSVALQYEEGRQAAPVVTAKGVDLVAEEIKRLAREHDVPILEQPPLARALFRDVPVGQAIPEKLYRAVAGVLAIVWRLRRERERARHPAPAAAATAGAGATRRGRA
jgi:flagellar biosynthesis protein FlhB